MSHYVTPPHIEYLIEAADGTQAQETYTDLDTALHDLNGYAEQDRSQRWNLIEVRTVRTRTFLATREARGD